MIVVEVVFLTVFWTWALIAILLVRRTVQPRMPLRPLPASWDVPLEPVALRATDGIRLEGWKVPSSQRGRLWIILCHGIASNRSEFLPIIPRLHQAGFNLLLVDFRGHGSSRGSVTSFGWREQRDLEGMLAYLGQQPDVPTQPYGVFGVAMGASVALMVAARDERLGAVVADSPYPTLEDFFRQQVKRTVPLMPRWPILWCLSATYRIRFGVWPHRVAPQDAIGRLSPRPLWLIQGAGDPSSYGQRLIQFFETHLSAGTPPVP